MLGIRDLDGIAVFPSQLVVLVFGLQPGFANRSVERIIPTHPVLPPLIDTRQIFVEAAHLVSVVSDIVDLPVWKGPAEASGMPHNPSVDQLRVQTVDDILSLKSQILQIHRCVFR